MSSEVLKQEKSPEKNELIDDNARKFIVDELDKRLLDNPGVVSFVLTTDWLEMSEDSEIKLARKVFANGGVQTLLIKKVTKNGRRESEKRKITDEEYLDLVVGSVLCVQKKRFEFNYTQAGINFLMKYDKFSESDLHVLEVDAHDDEERSMFDPGAFQDNLVEVTGDLRYYGYRVAEFT
jgi:hypothetical protein